MTARDPARDVPAGATRVAGPSWWPLSIEAVAPMVPVRVSMPVERALQARMGTDVGWPFGQAAAATQGPGRAGSLAPFGV